MTERELNAGWIEVCESGNVTPGEGFGVELGEARVGIYRLADGSLHAIGDICTHEFALLSDGFVEGDQVECPLHAALFDIRTGKCHGPMAFEDVPAYPIREQDGKVLIFV
jgi:nitrite reductase/ring-hydroxylating ferredoxin subunit